MPTQQQNHDYYMKNRERILKQNKQYAWLNKEKRREQNNARRRKWSQTTKGIYNTLKTNAKKRSVAFDLTIEEFEAFYQVNKRICYYCLVPEELLPDSFRKVCGRVVSRLSIDRADSSQGYWAGNILLCCFRCNAIKSDFLTIAEMIKVGLEIVQPKWKAEIKNASYNLNTDNKKGWLRCHRT